VLKIILPKIQDSGQYECFAVNGFGHAKLVFSVEFYGTYAYFILITSILRARIESERGYPPDGIVMSLLR